jgi:hypothetical protein
MPKPLPPGFVVDPVADVEREAARYVDMAPVQRGALVAAACRAAAAMLAARPDAAAALAHRDALPASTEAHLQRLRERSRRAA